jgi:hypothetical protein
MGGNNCTEPLGSGLYSSVLKRKISDVVLVDHLQDGFLLNSVDLRVLKVNVFSSGEFSESIIGNQRFGLLLRLAVN